MDVRMSELETLPDEDERVDDDEDTLVDDEGTDLSDEALEAEADSAGDEDKTSGKAESKAAKALAKAGGAIDRRDPLAVYMRDAQRYPLLSREEEHELAVAYFEHGDTEAARKLVTSNLRLVVKIAYDYRQAYKNLLDLVQEGNIGLMQAVKKYDPYRGVKLSSYAAWWIRAYILRYILNNHRLVKLGTTQAQRKLFFNLKKEKARLAAQGIDPTPERIADKLDVPVKDVISMDRRMAAGDASLDAPLRGADDGRPVSRLDMMSGNGPGFDEVIADEELGDMLKDKIHEYGATLEGRERVIFDKRLVAEDPLTLQALGDEFGVSRERVRQLEKRLLSHMKTFLRKELGEAVDVYEAE
ncbi:MAG: RNA polymerase factor sigma-32 [Deltaproteobacteria bacterium]|nr:RNA polymerase factor sigma-32 [Deltaproteobacteria bacterium]